MKIMLISIFALITLNGSAQEKIKISEDDYQNNAVEMADTFRNDGKIYVVVAVITVILSGLLIYVYATDRKLRKLEKEQANLSEKVKQ